MIKTLLDELYENNSLAKEKLKYLLENFNESNLAYLKDLASKTREKYFKNHIYLRGLLEISNYCSQDCIYCGINKNANDVQRYRLEKDIIIKQANMAYKQGIKTIVLQAGEDLVYCNNNFIIDIIKEIKSIGDIAITLSLGIRSFQSYQELYDAGATRYLLRHESANKNIFNKYHSMQNYHIRMKALNDLKQIGYQVGAGFIVGLDNNKLLTHLDDLLFLKNFNPHMVGIGPFIAASNTKLKDKEQGSLFNTLVLIGLTRLLLPKALIPATTALATITNDGYIKGIEFGANVIMPNIMPANYKHLYKIYNNKKNDELVNNTIANLVQSLNKNNLIFDKSKGDYQE